MKLRPIFSLALLLLICPQGRSQETPTITIKKGDAVAVSLQPLTGAEGAAATKVLENDLAISGWLNVVPGGQSGFTIQGSASAGSVEGRVVNAQGASVLSATYSGGTRSAVHQFADAIVEAITGNKGIATSRIAFVGTASGKKEIYIADYDGANVVQLTRDNSISVSPSLGPGARQLAYTGYQSGYADIYVINVGTGARNRVIKFPGTNTGAAISPDGGRMAVTLSKDGNPELYVTSIGGGGARRLTKTSGVEASPTWSPDASEIIYTSDDSGSPLLYRISASGGTANRLNTGASYNTEPSWSPDGKQVAFNTRGGGGFQIGLLDLARGSVRNLSTGGNSEDPTFGPSSRHVAYAQGDAIWIIDVPTGKTFKVISGVGKATQPSWSR